MMAVETLTAVNPQSDETYGEIFGEEWAEMTEKDRQSIIEEVQERYEVEKEEEEDVAREAKEEDEEYDRRTALYDAAVKKAESMIKESCNANVELSGWPNESRYLNIYAPMPERARHGNMYGDYFSTVRISDHPQPAFGGYSIEKGERHGEADLCLEIDIETGKVDFAPLGEYLAGLSQEIEEYLNEEA